MSKKIYKRFPIKLWGNECDMCCMDCDLELEECSSSCIKNEITCNQCKLGETDLREVS